MGNGLSSWIFSFSPYIKGESGVGEGPCKQTSRIHLIPGELPVAAEQWPQRLMYPIYFIKNDRRE